MNRGMSFGFMKCDDASPGREVPVFSVMMNRHAFRGEVEIETRSERADIVQLQILDLVRKRGASEKESKERGAIPRSPSGMIRQKRALSAERCRLFPSGHASIG